MASSDACYCNFITSAVHHDPTASGQANIDWGSRTRKGFFLPGSNSTDVDSWCLRPLTWKSLTIFYAWGLYSHIHMQMDTQTHTHEQARWTLISGTQAATILFLDLQPCLMFLWWNWVRTSKVDGRGVILHLSTQFETNRSVLALVTFKWNCKFHSSFLLKDNHKHENISFCNFPS